MRRRGLEQATATLRGLILDLRGNGGGDPAEVAKLTGAFAHGKTTSYWCDPKDHCRPNHTDDSVPPVNLKLVALAADLSNGRDPGVAKAIELF
jgi:C-terminal processing protease CtpA/Prc